MPVWLVTGASGFVGRHLTDAFGASGGPDVELVVLGRRPRPDLSTRSFFEADLMDPIRINEVLRTKPPDVVFHLAGMTPPAALGEMYRANTLSTVHLLDALHNLGRPVRVVLAGSAAELGPVATEDLPVAEGYPCRPVGEYALSKYLATVAGLAARPPLEVMIGRVFNPIGPGIPTSQALGRFAAQLLGATLLRMEVGRLDARRDFVDVRDVARALVALAMNGRPGLVYHVGTGHSHAVGEGLDRLIALGGRSVEVIVDPKAAGRAGPDDSRADITRIVEHTGWQPAIAWEQSLADLWKDARRRLALTG
ncbi:NAD-dependent epimerase/dehydratase family protein [Singulisphaera rosea]